MVPTRAVKLTALATLKGKWPNAIVTTILPFCATIVTYLAGNLLSLPMGNFSVIISAVMFVTVAAPLWLGALRSFWRMANNCEDSPTEVFYYFSDFKAYKRALSFNIRIFLRLFVAFTIFFIPAAIVNFFTSEAFYELIGIATPLWVLSFNFISGAFEFAALVACIIYILSVYLPAFLMVSSEEMKPAECIKRGIDIGRYTKNRFASYVFSYIGWILISVFMIPILFTAPYLLMSYVVACRFGVAHYNKLGDEIKKVPTHEV